MKTIFFPIFLLFFILSGCANRGDEGVVLAGIIFVICLIIIMIIFRPLFSILEKVEDIKDKKMKQFLFGLWMVCIIIILFNFDKIIVFVFKPLANLFR